jgi:hypothetical protein
MEIYIPHNYVPRDYQLPIIQAWEQGYKTIDLVAHRRSGKDKTCVAIIAKAMAQRVGGYYYIFPEFNLGRKALWDNLDSQGFRTLKHIPQELWASENSQQMKLTLKNGSFLQVVGSRDVDRLVGTNPVGIVFSEWSLQDPKARGYLNPILKENGGWAIYNYTPRGNNHAKKFHELAQNDPAYKSFTITVDETKIFSPEELEQIRNEYIREYGDDGLFRQEYYCSFETPVQGSYYGSLITMAEQEGRIGEYKHIQGQGVYTAWDLGASDSTAIWFYQKEGMSYRFIDYYETHGAGMQHFADVLIKKGYDYIAHYLPHDAENKVQARDVMAISRKKMLEEIGIQNIKIAPKVGVLDGIQKVRSVLPLCKFDSENCERGLACLKEYHQSWSEKNRNWSDLPEHDWSSHGADAFRYFAVSDVNEEPFIDPNIGRVFEVDSW